MNYKYLLLLAGMLLMACGDEDSSSVGPVNASSAVESSTDNGGANSYSSGKNSQKNSSSSVKKAEVVGGVLTDPRDGHEYPVMKTENQTWMAANLNYKVDSSWCYDDLAEKCEKYGRLYPWIVALQIDERYSENGWDFNVVLRNATNENHQGVCPPGWHIPSMEEFDDLIDYAYYNRFSNEAFCRLIKQDAWKSDLVDSSCAKFMEVDFDVLPAGKKDEYGTYTDMGQAAVFWSSNDLNSGGKKRSEAMGFYVGDVIGEEKSAAYVVSALSVRCVMD